MTVIEQVLLRKDIAALIVAIVVGLATASFLGDITSPIVANFNDAATFGEEASFMEKYGQPVVAFALQVLALEALLRGVILARYHRYKKVQ